MVALLLEFLAEDKNDLEKSLRVVHTSLRQTILLTDRPDLVYQESHSTG